MKMWTLHKDSKDIIHDCWNERVLGFPVYILSTKLKNFKNKLKVWNKYVFGNIHSLVHDSESTLMDIQRKIQMSGHTDHLMTEEKKSQTSLDDAHHK